LNDPEKVAPWLYRLAVRQTLLYRRKQGRRRKMVDRYAQRFRPSEANNRQADPMAWLLAEERRTQVRLAMSRLPKRDAEILLLKYNEDWSYDTLAKHLGISQSAVEARLHRARQRLRTELALLDVVAPGIRG
jgi:RNA polymerase sigma-70 factor (ECF subfamily)